MRILARSEDGLGGPGSAVLFSENSRHCWSLQIPRLFVVVVRVYLFVVVPYRVFWLLLCVCTLLPCLGMMTR